MKNLLFFDTETFSDADLKEVGAYEYLSHSSTEVVCAAWKFGTRETIRDAPIEGWCPQLEIGDLDFLEEALLEADYVIAHNAGFDRGVATQVLGIPQRIEDWICTAALAAAHALPRSLEGACEVLQLSRRKNPEGKALINQFSKPKRPTLKDPTVRNTDRDGLLRFFKYCQDDVEAMVELFLSLPPLTRTEREVYKLNQRINDRGISIDRTLVANALRMIEWESEYLNREVVELTRGELRSANQRAAVLRFIERHGLTLPNLQKETVENALQSKLAQGPAKRLLEIRQAISKTSTAKYEAFFERSRTDGRVRDLQLYHGAATGRESGAGVQIQNLPKPTLSDVSGIIEAVRAGDIQGLREVTDDVMEGLSSSIRGVIVPSPGYEMFCADFNAIEARVVLWLAGDVKGLRAFESGDPYKTEAVGVYRVPLEQITDEQRGVGKGIVLACGYGMGPDKFFLTCKQKGMPVSKELADTAVKAYRANHPRVVSLWRETEASAIRATQRPGEIVKHGRLAWYVKGKFLYCRLPSGRRLAYFGPEVKTEMTPWGEPRPKLYYWYQDPQIHQWKRGATYGGSLVENFTQATARDLMMLAQLRTEKLGYIPLMSVHDELVAERLKGKGSVKEFCDAMAVLPDWAEGLSVRVAGWSGDRYRK